jgi:UDP-N-acetylmuramoyl-L-alanyl-D-glutamate--2,6-diaminopimelate ligase
LEKVDWPALGGKGGELTVLIDYAHTDDALKNVLSTLKPLCRGRLILVFGCGGDRDRTKRPRMARVAEQLADLVIVTSDNPRTEKPEDIINEIIGGFESGAVIPAAALRETRDDGRETSHEPGAMKIVEPDRRKAIELAMELAAKDDIVLIAGKGHETYQIIGKQKFDFSDKKVAEDCLMKWIGDRESDAG